MLKYTEQEGKVIMKHDNLKTESERLEGFLQTEEFAKLPATDRSEKVMNLHYMKQHLMELSEEIATFVPTEVPDKPAKTIGLGKPLDGTVDNLENLN